MSQRLMVNTPVNLDGIEFKVLRVLTNSQEVVLQNTESQAIMTVPISQVITAWSEGRANFLASRASVRPQPPIDRAAGQMILTPSITLEDYKPGQREIAQHRLDAIKPLLDAYCSGILTRSMVQARVEGVKKEAAESKSLICTASVASIYRWLEAYCQGDDIRNLIPATTRRGAPGKTRVSLQVETIIDSVVTELIHTGPAKTVEDIHNEVAVRIKEQNNLLPESVKLVEPAASTITRRLEVENIRRLVVTRLPRSKDDQALVQYGQMRSPDQPHARVEIDHTKGDLLVVDKKDCLVLGRFTFTLASDRATRYPLGFYIGFEPPSYYAVMQCLQHTIAPKPDVRALYGTKHDWIAHGIPDVLVTDNGREFIGHDLSDACLSLGITLQHMPVRSPWLKGMIERQIGSSQSMLIHKLPGTTFSNPKARGDYDSDHEAVIDIEDLERILSIFFVDIHSQRFNRGLNGIPADRWNRFIAKGFCPRLPESINDLSVLLGRVEERTIQHYGVEFESLRFNTPELSVLRHQLKDAQTKIKYDPGDLTKIWVYDPFEKRYIEAPATNQDYVRGMSLWKHRVVRRVVLAEKGKVSAADLGEAKRKIQDIVDSARSDAVRRRKSISARAGLGRWEQGGSKPSKASKASVEGQILPEPPILPATLSLPEPAPTPVVPMPTCSPDQVSDAGAASDEDDWEIVSRPV